MSKNILIVEGEADRGFFTEVCKRSGLAVDVIVGTAKDFGGDRNSKEATFQRLPKVILPQLRDGKCERLAIVVDADSIEHGQGFVKTLERVSSIIAEFDLGYEAVTALGTGGLKFPNNDGLHPIGLWVMPDNQNDGMLENWIRQCIEHDSQGPLFQHACSAVSALPDPLFKPIRRTKAEIATWLAWQESPGEGLYTCITNELLDNNAALYTGLVTWLRAIFPEPATA